MKVSPRGVLGLQIFAIDLEHYLSFKIVSNVLT
jgi:hypothetical protein